MKKITKLFCVGLLVALGFMACKNDVSKGKFDGRTYKADAEESMTFKFEDGILSVIFVDTEDGSETIECYTYTVDGNTLILTVYSVTEDGKTSILEDMLKETKELLKNESNSELIEVYEELIAQIEEGMKPQSVPFVEDGDNLIVTTKDEKNNDVKLTLILQK